MNAPTRNVAVISTGSGAGHTEHICGTRKPALWWVFTSRHWVELPLNVYVIEHADGHVLFDTGADRRVFTDPENWPDRVTRLFMRNIFRWHGDLTYSEELLERDQTPATGTKRPLLESFAKVRALREVLILPAHDATAAGKLQRSRRLEVG